MYAQFLHDSSKPYSVRMNSNHHGFTFLYLAPLSSGGAGKVWTKIFSDGLQEGETAESTDWANPKTTDSCADNSDREGCEIGAFVGWWATDKLRKSGGRFTFTVPKATPPGQYILRAELLTTFLPGTVSTAQSYLGCAVVDIGDGEDQAGTLAGIAAGSTTSFPEAYQGAKWMYYDLHKEYANGNLQPPPGPPVWGGSNTGSSNGTASSKAVNGMNGRRKRRRREGSLMASENSSGI